MSINPVKSTETHLSYYIDFANKPQYLYFTIIYYNSIKHSLNGITLVIQKKPLPAYMHDSRE